MQCDVFPLKNGIVSRLFEKKNCPEPTPTSADPKFYLKKPRKPRKSEGEFPKMLIPEPNPNQTRKADPDFCSPNTSLDWSVCKMSALSLYILCSRTLNLRKTSLWFIIQMNELKKSWTNALNLFCLKVQCFCCCCFVSSQLHKIL